MTEQEQRIAIAEACPELFTWDGGELFWNPKSGHIGPTDILHDLNAMFVAWRDGLDEQQQWEFGDELNQIIKRECPESDTYRRQALETNATATQRAEAFLRTLGKWKDA